MLDAWIKDNRHLAPKSLKKYLGIIKQIEHKNREEIKEWIEAKSTTTAQNYLPVVNQWLKHIDQEIIEMKFRRQSKVTKYIPLSKAEVLKLRKQAKPEEDETNDHMYMLLELLLTTGIRIDEIYQISIYDLANKTKILVVGKGQKERWIFIGKEMNKIAIKIIEREQDDSPLNITFPNYQAIRRWLDTLCRHAGIRRITPHNFRSTYATNLHKHGISIFNISKLLGHEDIKTTIGYIESDLTELEVSNNMQFIDMEVSAMNLNHQQQIRFWKSQSIQAFAYIRELEDIIKKS